jgi:hypothetical protein
MTVSVCLPPGTVRAGGLQEPLPPKILVLRGVFEVFSLGMNSLARKLEAEGYDVKLTSWSLALLEARCSEDQPIVVIGHSLGGRACAWVPRRLKKCGKQVPLIIIVDANLIQKIPANVDRCVNLYVTNSLGIFHGSPVRGESACTEIVNWDVSQGQPSMLEGGVNHFNIDATAWVHDIIIDEIAKHFPVEPGFANDQSVPNMESASDSRLLQEPFSIEVPTSGVPRANAPFKFDFSAATRAAKETPPPNPTQVVWRPNRPDDARQPTIEGGETAPVDTSLEALRIKPASSGWRPRSPRTGQLPAPESSELATAGATGPAAPARPQCKPLEWRPARPDTHRRPAVRGGRPPLVASRLKGFRTNAPRIRLPAKSPRL